MDMQDYVLVLDFGSQFTQLIARRCRELKVYSEIKPYSHSVSEIMARPPKAIILSGGPCGVADDNAPRLDPKVLQLQIPIFGVCYGMQLIANQLGGQVSSGASREYGPALVEILEAKGIFSGFSNGEQTPVWMSHGDFVSQLPPGFQCLARSSGAAIAAMCDRARAIYCTQFHPEVFHSARGTDIIRNFLFKIAGCEASWNSERWLDDTIEKIGTTVGSASVVCGLSGGVDSTVAATIVSRAINEQLYCILVDNGLLRKNEAERIEEMLGSRGLGLNLRVVDAADRFIEGLKGVTDPEQKRKIIGRIFIEVFEEQAASIKGVTHLVQGTLYPDVIESSSVNGPSAVIKSHHNVGGLPERMKLKLIEPLRELFKDEVRRIGSELHIPSDLIKRQPFPGPGLAVRIVGEVTRSRLDILREADRIFDEEIRAAGLYDDLWQSFAVLLPVRSVGVMGDGRTYDETIALRAVQSEDGMTADWYFLPEELLRTVSKRVINEVPGVNRVVLDISSKPPATIEWE